jgi:hypothetical protein
LEKIVDDTLQQFDRKSIKRYLKKDVDGSAKNSLQSVVKEVHKQPEDVRQMVDKVKGTRDLAPIMSPEMKMKKQRRAETAPDHAQVLSKSDSNFSKSLSAASLQQASSSLKRPHSALDNNIFNDNSPDPQSSPVMNRSGKAFLPAINSSSGSGFTRDKLNNTIPIVPPRTAPGPKAERKQAWASSSAAVPAPTIEELPSQFLTETEDGQKTNPLNPAQAESVISAGLIRIADQLARKILPWQAVLCPRAVETLQDLRLSMIQAKHTQFMNQMKSKLEEKVSNFIRRKEEEVDTYLEKEVNEWQKFLEQDEMDLSDYIKIDIERITNRAIAQDSAYRQRELRVANTLDDNERDNTRQQLVNFRRIVRASKRAIDAHTSLFETQPQHVEVRTLQNSIAQAQSTTRRKAVDMSRSVVRRQEEAHDWLCSLADNAMTAGISEVKLKDAYAALDAQKGNSMDSLHKAMALYKEQHNSILEAIVVFAGRIHQHASDYLQREQLVSRAFMQYLLGIISGEIRPQTAEQKKHSYAWETKALIDRAHRKEIALIQEFHSHMDPLDGMVNEFKEKMRLQLEHITMKLQSVVNGKENDINARKASIHKKLAKHVNKACNARRQRLKDATAIRRDEFELESRAMSKVEELCGDLKGAIDTFWVKEHLKERKIYEASLGRLERLEKSALIIWNKHSHIAMDQKEEYQDWLETYKRDRDDKIRMRKIEIEDQYRDWAEVFVTKVKSMSIDLRKGFKYLISTSFIYDINATVEQNLLDLEMQYDSFRFRILDQFQHLRMQLDAYISVQMSKVDKFSDDKKAGLLLEWRENLVRLDDSINRRIGRLKDMEADLEETIRLTILQHEVENSVFEQLSCSRYEGFWIDWRKKMDELSKELITTQEDFELLKRGSKQKARTTKKDRAIDDLLDVAKESGAGNKSSNNRASSKPVASDEASPMKKFGPTNTAAAADAGAPPVSDTMRIKIILDDIRAELFRDFIHKLTRSLEKVRRDLGEGKKQLIPPYAAAKCIAVQCERFYEKAKLSERCVGRISSRGHLLFQEGLPPKASAMFSMSTTMAMISLMKLRECKYDCDDIFTLAENMKVFFLIGLLSLTNQYGEFGEYMIRCECLWACSTLEINPPYDLIQNSLARGLKESVPLALKFTGIFSEDPVDLFNHLIDLPTDLNAIQNQRDDFQELLARQDSMAPTNGGNASQSGANSSAYSEPPLDTPNHNASEPPDIYEILKQRVPFAHQMQKLASLFPHNDVQMMATLLGRPEGSFELTTHRVCQVIAMWRRTSIAIAQAAMDPPNSEYPRIQDIVTAHQASISGKKRMNYGNINCISPFEAVSIAIDYITSIHGLPISVLQAMMLLSRGGSVDPWMEDPKQSFRHERIVYEIQELVDMFTYRIPKSMIHDEYLQVTLPKSIADSLTALDMNYSNVIPLEIFRSYLQRDDANLTNNQVSMVFWSLCRVNEEFEDPLSLIPDVQPQDNTHNNQSNGSATQQLTVGGGYRPVVSTPFEGDPEEYMVRFGKDVDRYLDSMPTLDANVILGMVPNALTPAAAHELVSDAMKLDPSARNPMPTTCCIWLGQRLVKHEEALHVLILPGNVSKDGNYVVGVTRHAYAGAAFDVQSLDAFIRKVRVYVELDLLTKYPEICEIRASDRHYGPAGNDPMVSQAESVEDNHWRELLNRRINRLDKLTISWRDTMLSEWAASLYQSRQMRYEERVRLVQQSVSVYHTQYQSLREAILSERGAMMSMFRGMENELMSFVQDDFALITFHSSFLERALRRFEGEFERIWLVMRDMMLHFVRHAGSIKRESINRVNKASITLREELENSCNGLIMGYTAGYAQGFFDGLVHRGEIWRSRLTELQGQLILIKEKFMAAKDEIDRDLTIQITDRLTLNRTATKFHLEQLNEDSARMLDQIATTRTSYANLQKDANARLILRIEKCIREARKLRTAAESDPDLEGPVLRDIRVVLNIARQACLDIVRDIQAACLKQLHALHPVRSAHRRQMEEKVAKIDAQWQEINAIMQPLVSDYEREMLKELYHMNTHALELIHVYKEHESKALSEQFTQERRELILAFRKHFREYDLSEAAIFERYNVEINRTVADMLQLWGPSKPKFITQSLREFRALAQESLHATQQDVRKQMFVRDLNDETTCARMAIADHYAHQLHKVSTCAEVIPVNYLVERDHQIAFIDEMSMEKNGDMVRPQVKAVLDLLVAGIEIDFDFGKGYDNLVVATNTKSQDARVELGDFVTRYSKSDYPVSIPQTAILTRQRIQARQDEINALQEASHSHLVADHSKLDVLFGAGEKDIEEWSSLTLQLIENAFHNAETNYLSNLWPTPEPTPRLELLPEDEDRVGKLKALLAKTQQDSGEKSYEFELIRSMASNASAVSSMASSPAPHHSLALTTQSNANLTAYKGDTKLLLESLQIDEAEEEAFRQKKDAKRLEKERRRQEKEEQKRQMQPKPQLELPVGKVLPELQTKELQQGWFECIAPEGYTYYHNPVTGESLWDLPQILKRPLHADEDDEDDENYRSQLVDTPRELLMLESGNQFAPETIPIRVVPDSFRLNVQLDPKVIMSEIAEEARTVSTFAFDTAVDITNLIFGRAGKDERTIATLLGDRYDPHALKKLGLPGYDSDEEDDFRLRHKLGEESAEEAKRFGQDLQGGLRVPLLEDAATGQLTVLDGSDGLVVPSAAVIEEDVQQLLLELGMQGEHHDHDHGPMLRVTDASVPAHEIVQPDEWLQLGLVGTNTKGDWETNSSDGEDYTGFNQQDRVKMKNERKYAIQRELDRMAQEDALSTAYENEVENRNCQELLAGLTKLVESRTATAEDKELLVALSLQVKPVNVIDIMAALKTSWAQIDEIIDETLSRNRQRQEQIEQLRTEKGRQRQQMILEHAEDTEEMMAFLIACQVSKVEAKRIAIECLTKHQCPTAKKLSKLVARGQISLKKDLQIDDDDVEEVDAALRTLLMTTAMSNMSMSMSQPMSRNSSMLDVLPRATSFSPFASAQLPLQAGLSSTVSNHSLLQHSFHLPSQHGGHPPHHSSSSHSLHSLGSTSERSGFHPTASQHNSALSVGNGLTLDPQIVTEVEDEAYDYDDDMSSKLGGSRSRRASTSSAPGATGSAPTAIHPSTLPRSDTMTKVTTASGSTSMPYQLTPEGYKSFTGGWIEGVSEENHVYYYNVKTGASSWHLPTMAELEEQEEAEKEAQVRLHHGHGGEDLDGTAGTLPFFTASQLDPFGSRYQEDADPTTAMTTTMPSGGTDDVPPHESYPSAFYPAYDDGPSAYAPHEGDVPANGGEVDAYYPLHDDAQAQWPGYYDDAGMWHYYEHDPSGRGYYDEHGQLIAYETNEARQWTMSDALGVEHIADYVPPPKPRAIPSFSTPEVEAFAQKEGVARQMVLLSAQDKWQNNLVKVQHMITDQKTQYLTKRVEMFEKATKLVEDRLNAFVEDIKFMQKSLKKDLGECLATQRDLRRLFEESAAGVMRAEKLSFVLESLEKLKRGAKEKYESAFMQIDKFAADWELLKQELLQVGDLYDTGIATNLDQCRLGCEHFAKLFTYDQLKATASVAKGEMVALRRALHGELMSDTAEATHAREAHRAEQRAYHADRMTRREALKHYYYGQGSAMPSRYLTTAQEAFLDGELAQMGYGAIAPAEDMLTEEELVMSFLIKQIEMEASLRQDYESILEASRSMALDLQSGIEEFDTTEKRSVVEDGSWFNKHRDTLERHEQALHGTLTKVRDKMNEGYQDLQARIEALDYEVESAAENELFQSSLHSK